MIIADFQILADENISPEIVEFLRNKEIVVESILETNQFGKSDKEILKESYRKNQIILTQDSDFGTLIFREKIDFTGIIYLRPGHFQPAFHIKTLETLFENKIELTPSFILVARNMGDSVKVRLRTF